jgi:hypothetical protein
MVKLILRIGVHGFGLVVRFSVLYLHLLFRLSFRSLYALSKLLSYIFLLSPVDKLWSQVNIYSCSYTDIRGENIRGLYLAVVKLTTVQVTILPLQHKIRKICMICSAKRVLTEDLYIVKKQEFSITCCKCDTYAWRKAKRQRGCT